MAGSKGNALLITAPLPDRARGYHAFDHLLAADDGEIGTPAPSPNGRGDKLARAERKGVMES